MNYGRLDGRIRCERRGCSKYFLPNPRSAKAGSKKQRFCSSNCRKLEWMYASGKKKRQPVGMCRNGHIRTPENTYLLRGVSRCRECATLQQRRRQAAPEYRAWKRDYRRRYHQEHRERILAQAKVKRALGLWS